ncbi:hypothetical protein E2562_011365 [Oryza meyeriana var. granulata]|uniref:Uncharacterized protein n=1 Tax=Oryza meyeriana var. granulata TaxID=110450 RepID=A0A6G1BW27_9ORYZ|nr:hypothetical protein E2562_011365 [Oryza meyeriana var. granulata]
MRKVTNGRAGEEVPWAVGRRCWREGDPELDEGGGHGDPDLEKTAPSEADGGGRRWGQRRARALSLPPCLPGLLSSPTTAGAGASGGVAGEEVPRSSVREADAVTQI